MRCASIFLALTLLLAAQGSRTVCALNGARDSRIQHEGQVSAAESEGHWALRCAPASGTRFYGITVGDLWGSNPKVLLLRVFLEGETPLSFQLRLEDEEGMSANDAAAWLDQTLNPGWNALKVDLTKLISRKGARAIDRSKGLRRIRLSRRAEAGNAAFRMESVGFEGESAAAPSATTIEQVLALPVNAARARELAMVLTQFSPSKAFDQACEWLTREGDEQARKAARDALQRIDDPKLIQRLVQRSSRASPERVELLSALATNGNTVAAAAAAKTLADPKLPLEERVAVLRGLARVGRWNPALELAAPANSAWPLRAGLLESALYAASDDAIDTVISCVGAKESSRVSGPAIAALIARLGTDLGHDAVAWKELWNVRRGQASSAAKNSKSAGYGSFYGIPMDPGRVVFVLDGSGSMREEIKGGKAAEHIKASAHLKGLPLRTRLDLLQAELVHVLSKLPSETKVGIVFFNDDVLWLSKGIEPLNDATRERLSSRVRAAVAGQATNIHDGMWAAFHPTGKAVAEDVLAGPDTIVVLTDGAPSAGPVKDQDTLSDAILRWDLGRAVRIHSVNVGNRASRWMQRVSLATNGVHQDLSSDRTNEGTAQ